MDLAGFIRTVWLNKWLIGLCGLIGIILGGYWAYFQATPMFRSEAVVILDTRQGQVVDLQNVTGGITGTGADVASEVEVLRARVLMGRVVDQLNLTEDPEFNRRLQPPGPVARLRAQLPFLPQPNARAARTPEQTRDATVSALLRAVTVRSVPQTYVFRIAVETENRQKSALIADTIAQTYIDNQLEEKFKATETATAWLTGRVSELQITLEEAEIEVQSFSRSTDLVSPETLSALERQLKDQRDRRTDAAEVVAESTATLAALEAAQNSGQGRAAQVALFDSDQMTLLARRADTDANAAEAVDRFLTQQAQQLELNRARATSQIATLDPSIAQLDEQISQQSADLITLQQLSREAEATRLLYEYFLTRLKETAAQEGIQQADSRLLSSAVVPNGSSSPNKRLAMMMAGVIGAMLGLAWVLQREVRTNVFRDGRSLEATTGLTVLGQIPLLPMRRRIKQMNYIVTKPASAMVEAVRNMRTSLLMPRDGRAPQVILSTSSVPGEGKTTNSIALAHSLVGTGKSVLLIEGDIRRNTLKNYFLTKTSEGEASRGGQGGLVTAAKEPEKLGDLLITDTQIGAHVLLGENTRENAADFFTSAAFEELMATLRQTYDYIIVDSPPVLLVPDARIMARHADAVIFTVLWNGTGRE
ncbi:MAG: AAA family ATPase, partial [Pseudomonadota bacterium]